MCAKAVTCDLTSMESEMSMSNETMTRKIFLDIYKGVEGICADLYHYYSRSYEDIPDASRLWEKTAFIPANRFVTPAHIKPGR